MKPLNPVRTDVLPDFCFEERSGSKIWVDPSFACEAFISQLTNCDLLLDRTDCQIIKDQKKIRVGRLGLHIAGREHNFFIKRYNAFSLRYRIGSLMKLSGAVKSLRGTSLLQGAGIRTVRPVAAVEHRVKGVLSGSFFITEELHGAKTADAYWIEDLSAPQLDHRRERRRNFLIGLGHLFRSLHAAQIYHNDLKDANILVVSLPGGLSQAFFLLDLEGVKRYAQLSHNRKIKNLVQLNRTLGRYIRRSGKLYFMKNYLGAAFADKRRTKRMLLKIVAESVRLDALKGIGRGTGYAGVQSRRA